MRRLFIELIAACALLVVIALLWAHNGQLRTECDTNARNAAALMTDVEHYRVRDSLNAAKCSVLELSLSEYKQYRAQDMALIAELRVKKRDLERITAAQTQTIIQLSGAPRDTVVIRDSVAVPAKILSITDKWYDFDGLLAGGEFTGTVVCRDSLLIVESVTMSRCIVKRWRKVKKREIDVISRNPHTIIQGVEHVIIEK